MRVLFTVIPEKTIFLSQVPLAWALRTAGHDVRVASQPWFASVITQAGLTAVPVGRDVDLWRMVNMSPELVEIARGGLHAPFDVAEDPAKASWDYLVDGYHGAVADGHKPNNFPMISGLVDFARHWRPDLVIWEPLSYAGAIAAKACGAAHARLPWGLDILGVTRDRYLRLKAAQPVDDRTDPLADWLAGYGDKYGFGFSEDMATGQVTVSQLPASLQLTADLTYLPMRYVPYGGPASVPAWLWAAPTRPRVALTLGTTAVDILGGYAIDVRDILDALADLDIELVATIATTERERLAHVPANARLVPFVPLHALAPTCTAVIHHGGFGTLTTFALHGVPQLALPCHFEGPLLGRQLTGQGAGLAEHSHVATGESVRDGLLRLLHEPTFAQRADALRTEVQAMPDPNRVAAQLQELCLAGLASG